MNESDPRYMLNSVLDGVGLPSTASAPSTIGEVVILAVNVMIGVGFSVSILAGAWSAWEYIFSEGNPDKVQNAWRVAMWAGISVLVTILAVAIKNAAFNAIGANPDLANVDTTL